MRILHTADWHLGHVLHDFTREHEHARFLDWLLDVLGREQVDALVVAGDIFDVANPGAATLKAFYDFLGDLRRRHPRLDALFIGGNHDSPGRLHAPEALLRPFGVRVVGALPRTAAGALDPERILAPLHDRAGATAAWVAAVPFLRESDLPPAAPATGDPLIEGVRRVYTEAVDAARARCGGRAALVATGHCHCVGTSASDHSERKILGGNLHPLPADVFPDDLAYVALGHLHLAQPVGGSANVRYSGSPLPLSLPEAAYPHEVTLVELDAGRFVGARSLPVPRTVAVLRVPGDGAHPLEDVLAECARLPEARDGPPREEHPYLELRILLDRPDPTLRARVDEALRSKGVRLARLGVEYVGGTGQALPEATRAATLRELTPEQVFRTRYRRDFQSDPPLELLAAYHELLDQVGREEQPS